MPKYQVIKKQVTGAPYVLVAQGISKNAWLANYVEIARHLIKTCEGTEEIVIDCSAVSKESDFGELEKIIKPFFRSVVVKLDASK